MKNVKPARFAARLGIYCLGLWVLAVGIALSVNCKLGVSPVSSLPYVLSQIVNVSLGTCTTIVYTGKTTNGTFSSQCIRNCFKTAAALYCGY